MVSVEVFMAEEYIMHDVTPDDFRQSAPWITDYFCPHVRTENFRLTVAVVPATACVHASHPDDFTGIGTSRVRRHTSKANHRPLRAAQPCQLVQRRFHRLPNRFGRTDV